MYKRISHAQANQMKISFVYGIRSKKKNKEREKEKNERKESRSIQITFMHI